MHNICATIQTLLWWTFSGVWSDSCFSLILWYFVIWNDEMISHCPLCCDEFQHFNIHPKQLQVSSVIILGDSENNTILYWTVCCTCMAIFIFNLQYCHIFMNIGNLLKHKRGSNSVLNKWIRDLLIVFVVILWLVLSMTGSMCRTCNFSRPSWAEREIKTLTLLLLCP